MSLIRITDLSFAYEGASEPVFEHVNFQIDTDWKLGFTGRNGRGKTTFLKILMGELAYTGEIAHSVRFGYFPYPVEDMSKNTIDVARQIHPDFADWELERELSLLRVDENVLGRPFHTLSNGERTKVLLATLFLKENAFLLIDEPTNHLDGEGRRVVAKYLNGKRGFILVSHDRKFLDECVDHILAINRADIEIQRGNFSTWYENKTRADNFALERNEKLKRDIRRLAQSAEEKSQWSNKVEKTKNATRNSGIKADKGYIGHKSAKMMQRAKTIEARKHAALAEKTGLLENLDSTESLKLAQLPYHANRLVSLSHVTIAYGDVCACRDVSFTIERGDRVALCGKNGSGKSSVVKLICGMDLPYTGLCTIGSQLKISYVAQDTSELAGDLNEYAARNRIDVSLFKAILRKLDFSRAQFEKDMRDFSGGQKKKVLIARSLSEEAHLHVWDEPLNFIDVLSRIQIEELILRFQPTLLFVEHDGMFAEHIATKTVLL